VSIKAQESDSHTTCKIVSLEKTDCVYTWMSITVLSWQTVRKKF